MRVVTYYFLPPYSPDLNPIEHVWSPLKNRVRMKLDQDEINLETALSQVMKSIAASHGVLSTG
ncbi:hypothetical protein AVI51_13590 [Piscirickettsia salmonis]|nr:transposase [Piscirickettsia salmonis]ALA24056.1 DDE superendonuclease family protein [Piscirickettsia salmonis]APS44460.1 hypothetical protein AVI48_08850 [Piscirickettsia salmonis]APS47821.1 hypothetical protein AVI49_09455 [Piscirickettsia salmonis]APS51778.1 hypothetical protein AVI50_13715 [Piscirickettsia salmonis]APS54997.1 hypothetical protein AVI51_13590 [Piscirickettsia salmonis]